MIHFILAITPNPALDLGGVVDNLKPNEKSYVHDETRSPGGNAINAARILTRLKIPVIATGFLGGSTGEEIKGLLDFEGVKNKFVKIKGHSRICVSVSNKENHKQTRLTFPGPQITHQEKENLFRLLKNQKNISFILIGGSFPQGMQAIDVLALMSFAKARNIKCIVDCPGNILRTLIAGGPTLIKPNLTEFQDLTQSRVTSMRSVCIQAQKFLEEVPYICVSSVEGGALLVTRDNSYFGHIPKIKIRSTVGAGDSMLGAMSAQLYKNNTSADDILRWGLASATASLAQPGTAFGSAKEIKHFYKMTTVKKIKIRNLN
ncbi:MAG: 1-phosphofructokinase family hexose kinase [Bacteriovorax sp.]|nr:1-phosphofructokinase family hexose kinase [Bacteriovorax sp.]